MKSATRIHQLLLLCGAVLAVLVTTAATAQAAPDTATVQRQAVGTVLTAADPTAAYTSLSAPQQALFRESLQHIVGVTTVSEGSSPQLAAASGCWYRYWYTTWSDLGYTEGATWMTLNWCGNGKSVTSHSLGAHGGKSLSPGFSYQGIASTGGLGVGWEYRQYVEYAFHVGIGPINTTLNPCMQIRGGAGGLYSERKSCNLG
jgi:hypothetical protein